MAAPRSVGPAVFLGLPPTLNTLLVPPGVYGSMVAPRSVGPAVFLGSPPTLTLWVPPGVCGAMAAPRSVGPAVFLGSPPTQNTLGPSWSVRLHGRSSQCGTRGLLGLTANPQHLKRLEHQTSAVDVQGPIHAGVTVTAAPSRFSRPHPVWMKVSTL